MSEDIYLYSYPNLLQNTYQIVSDIMQGFISWSIIYGWLYTNHEKGRKIVNETTSRTSITKP
jgi:hypothetical protein